MSEHNEDPSGHKIDREGWSSGAWDNEQDYYSWTDEATGLPCLIVRNQLGALCGYAAVERGHPFYGIQYDECSDNPTCGKDYCGHRPVALCDEVHGGLTYSDACADHICHVPEPGKPDDVWWFGFDCAHGCDFMPGHDARMRELGLGSRSVLEVYRSVSYVKRQCALLARELANAAID